VSFFSELLEDLDKDRSKDIKAYLENQDLIVEDKPPLGLSDVIRASSIWNFCPRMEALRVQKKLTLRDEVSGRLSRIFRFGRVFERHLRDMIFGVNDLLIGKWHCAACERDAGLDLAGAIYRVKPRDKCKNCGAKLWSYTEILKVDDASNVGGHTDGFIKWADDYAILEIKTANEWSFKSIRKANRPMQSHFAQTQVYMHLHGYKKALVWYYNKNTSDQETFWIEYDPSFARAMLDKATQFRDFLKSDQTVLPARLCSDKKCPRAKECPLRDVCFQGVA